MNWDRWGQVDKKIREVSLKRALLTMAFISKKKAWRREFQSPRWEEQRV